MEKQRLAGKRVLYLEDEKIFYNLAREYCDYHDVGLELIHVTEIEQAISLFNQGNIDIILSDYYLKGENGIDFLKYIRKKVHSDIPFIFISSSDDHRIVIEALNQGADYFYEKVFIFNDLETNSKSLFTVMEDVIENKSNFNHLLLEEKLKKIFNITTHDAKNNLTVIGLATEMILEDENLSLETRSLVNKIIASRQAILESLSFAVDYYKLGEAKSQWNNLYKIIEECKKTFSSELFIINEIPPGLNIFGDALIKKAFYNIIENSIRHGNATCVKCLIEETEDEVIIFVKDNGKGVKREDKSRIFKQGYGKNTGYGLFFCKEVFIQSNISIVEVGKNGACFMITIPKAMFRLDI